MEQSPNGQYIIDNLYQLYAASVTPASQQEGFAWFFFARV
jgi:hypothetical protein